MKAPGKIPPGEAYVKMTRDLVESDAWRSLGINSRRVVDFLIREHLRHGGQENGRLKAPQKQLQVFGIGTRYVVDAITQAEARGVVECRRGGMRTATLYALTWLPTFDGKSPSNRWRTYRDPALRPLPIPKRQKSATQREGSAAPQREGRSPNLPRKGKADQPENLPLKGRYLSRRSYQDGGFIKDLSDEELADLAHADGDVP